MSWNNYWAYLQCGKTLPILYGMRSIHPPEIDPGLIKNNNKTSKQTNKHKAYLQIFYFISKIFIITLVIIFSLYCFFSQHFDLVFRLKKFFFKLFGLIMENRTKDRDFWNTQCLPEPLGNKQSEQKVSNLHWKHICWDKELLLNY